MMPAMPRPTDQRRPDVPMTGYFRIRLVRGGPFVAASIDITADGLWRVMVNGEPSAACAEPWDCPGMERVWFYGHRIDHAEHDYLVALSAHARAHDATHPLAQPGRPIDLHAMAPIYRRKRA